MDDQIVSALKAGEWMDAIRLIDAVFPYAGEKEKPGLAYNLIVSYINLGDWKSADFQFQKHSALLNASERKEIQKELKKLMPKPPKQDGGKEETKMTDDGQIKKLGFFVSTTKLDDVIGLSRMKKKLKTKIINPILHPEKYRAYGAKLSSGAVLYGPPGSGKTFLASAVCGEANGKMLLVKIPEIISKYFGNTEKNIKELFREARQNKPAIIFMDEMDGVAQDRSEGGDIGFGAAMKSMIGTMLDELDGIQKNNDGIYVIGATNLPWAIDSAFKRPGRFGEKIYIGPPNRGDREALFKYYASKIFVGKLDYMKLSLASFGMTPNDIMAVCDSAAKNKASDAIEGKPQRPISNNDILREIKAIGKPLLFEWYAKALKEFRKMPPEERNQYPELKKDIVYWSKKANADYKTQLFLSTIF